MPSVITPCGGNRAAFEGARVHSTTNQTTNNSTQTPLSFDTVDFDTDVMFALVAPDRLTVRTAGVYVMIGNFLYAANATGQRQANITRNGDHASSIFLARNVLPANTVPFIGTAVNVSAVWSLAVGEYVQLLALQQSGGALDVLTAAVYSASFSAVLIG